MNKKKGMTTSSGAPVADNQNSITAGPRGPVLLQDFQLIEKMAQFNRERVPERIVHARGTGAHGTFVVTGDITQYTKARLFSEVGKETPVFSRFSRVAGEMGSADTARDPRGFSVKFYTEEGNWDMVGNNTPVFFVRDALKFSDFIHSQKRDPRTGMRSATMQWDFFSLSPESLHQVTTLYTDRGTPDGYRFMQGFSSHTYSLYNEKGERYWCKWHFKSMQGVKNLTREEAVKLAGTDPDYATRDLFEAIERKDFPHWKVYIQVMPEIDAETFPINPFDLTTVWSHKDVPMIEVGVMELNRNPDNHFAEVEQSAFAPSNIVPGMGFSPDKVLQARVFSYADAQRYRIGTNYQTLPVNKPLSPPATYHRDGAMRFDDNGGASPVYEPNSFGGPVQQPQFQEPPLRISGDASRYDGAEGADDFSQAGALFRLLAPVEREHLIANITADMQGVPEAIQIRQIRLFMQADPVYGQGVARGLDIPWEKVMSSEPID